MYVLLSLLKKFEPLNYPWLHNTQILFQGPEFFKKIFLRLGFC